MFDAAHIRHASWQVCRGLGLPVNDALPLLEASLKPRSAEDIQRRALALHAVVACSYGYSNAAAVKWLSHNGLQQALTAGELDLLSGQHVDMRQFQAQGHSLHALAWVLGRVPRLKVEEKTPDSLVTVFPDLLKSEGTSRFGHGCRLREFGEVVGALDLHFCAHWAATHLSLTTQHIPLDRVAVRNKRWALEWVLGDVEWNEVALDT